MAPPREVEKLESQYQDNPEGTVFAPLANAYRKLGNSERAIEILSAGLVHHPDYAPGRIVLGRCLLDRGDDEAAEMEFIRVLEVDEENVIALQALADIAERDARYKDSEGWINALLVVDAGNAGAREQLSRVVTGEGTAPSAEAPVEEALPEESLESAAALEDSSLEALPGLEQSEPVDLEPALPVDEEPEAIGEMELEAVELPADLEPLPELDAAGVEEAEPIADEVAVEEPESIASVDLEFLELEKTEAAPEEIGVVGAEAGEQETLEEVPEEAGVFDEEDVETGAVSPEPETPVGAPGEPVVIPVVIEEEEGVQEGDEAPAILSDLAFEEDSVLGLADAPPAEEPRALTAEPSAVGQEADLGAVGVPAEPGTILPDDPLVEPEAEPEPVATETMAELYLSQGHRLEALGIYRLLLAQHPEDSRLREKVAALEEEGRQPAPTHEAVPSDYAATTRGGQSITDFFRVLLSSRPDSEPPHVTESTSTEEGEGIVGAEPEAPSQPAGSMGEPTRPAHDRLLLSSVFGEDASPVPPALPRSGEETAASSTGRFSFDAFFGGQRGEMVRPPEAASDSTRVEEEEDLDQFRAWLQSLKG